MFELTMYTGLIVDPFADHAVHLADMLAHLLEHEAEREKPLRRLARRAADQAVTPHRVEFLGVGLERGLDLVKRRRRFALAQRGGAGAQEIAGGRRDLF